jgi:hypothetical protein
VPVRAYHTAAGAQIAHEFWEGKWPAVVGHGEREGFATASADRCWHFAATERKSAANQQGSCAKSERFAADCAAVVAERRKTSCQTSGDWPAEGEPPLDRIERRKFFLNITYFINNSPLQNRSFRRRCARPQAAEKAAKQPVI